MVSQQLQPVWNEIEKYIDLGLSVIPCYDQGENVKKSCIKWNKYQSERLGKPELFELMERFNTTAVSIICGEISGNLEIIDIDVKNWLGIDVRLFGDIKDFMPDVFSKLRIHKSPSGGFHIPFFGTQTPPKNQKLCRKLGVKEAAIETRGTGGYFMAPPSMGYKVVKDAPIPTLTDMERESLITLCRSYDENVKVENNKPTQKQNDFYDENPFDHYNGSNEAESVLVRNGWRFLSENSRFIHFERPGQTAKGRIGASFNKDGRYYYFFTSSCSPLEEGKGYTPARVLGLLEHGGDFKRTFSYLVSQGFGRINPKKEKDRAVAAARRGILPDPNMSQEALDLYEQTKSQLNELHPFGTFFEYDDEGQLKIDRRAFEDVAVALGFMRHDGDLVQVLEGFIYRRTPADFYEALKDYIKEEQNIFYNTFDIFAQHNNKWKIGTLPTLDDSAIFNDTKDLCFKFYSNGVLAISADGFELLGYDTLDRFVWAEKIQPRPFLECKGGKYVDFLDKATGITDTLRGALGFLCHEFKDETTAYIVVLSETCENPADGGGSGKNVFCSLLKYATTYTSKPGSQTKFDEKFFQSWNRQRVFAISDVPKNFDFSFLKEISSGTFIWKKLFENELIVPVEKAPKMIVQTNYSYEIVDGGLKRRIVPVEFTNFFTVAGGIDVHYNCHFPKGWDEQDWGGFDTFIAESIQFYIANKLKVPTADLSEGGWLKQFEQTYGPNIHQLIEEHWENWVALGDVPNDDFKNTIAKFYDDNSIPKPYQPSSMKINRALEDWGKKRGVLVVCNNVKKVNGIVGRFRTFIGESPF